MADALLILDGGLFSTLQDEGRFGYARFGISPAGAMDAVALRLAAALVGGPDDMAAIECTLNGPTFTVEADRCRLAFAGTGARITLNDAPVPNYRAFDAVRGDRVAVGPCAEGLRGYLAVKGGFAVAPVLGSRSTHSRASIGGFEGRALRAGDRLSLADPRPDGPWLELPPAHRPRRDGTVRVLLGPQDDAFTAEGVATFLSSAYTVSDKADRMGCQLDGPAVAHRSGFNIVSDGIVNGSIQVPGHGRPVVLLADHQTTGGYPKIATVIGADLPVLAQVRPGAALRFAAVSTDEAERIALEAHRHFVAVLAAIVPASGPAAPTTEQLLAHNLISGVHRAD